MSESAKSAEIARCACQAFNEAGMKALTEAFAVLLMVETAGIVPTGDEQPLAGWRSREIRSA